MKPDRIESAYQIRRKIFAIITGLMVPGLTGWASSVHFPTLSDWIIDFISSILAPDGSFSSSWPWALFIALAAVLLVYCVLVIAGMAVIRGDPTRARLWIILLPITLLTLATVLQFPGAQLLAAVSASMAAMAIVVGLWPLTPEKEKPFTDELYRTFFSSRICELLKESHSPITRIAILGSWGEGKTSLLKLIQQSLNESESPKFATAWVNPWGAQTREEAWEILASGLDLAITEPLLLSRGWHRNRWMKVLFSLLPGESLGRRMLEAASSHLTQAGEAELALIDKKLSKLDKRVVIIVDDMERAEPEVIRGVLPVIDSLTKLKNCSFVFAIDPERMGRAFASKTRLSGKWNGQISNNSGQLSSGDILIDSSADRSELYGYLDKVMDLILELPEPTAIQMQEWAGRKVLLIANRCPKLNQAFPKIAPLLPTNPRDCEKYLKLAERVETLFLGYYRHDEKNFLALFFVLLGQSLFPGFRKALASDAAWVNSIETHGILGKVDLRDSPEVAALFERMTKEIGSPKVALYPEKLRDILTGIGEQVGLSAFDSGYPSIDAQWITSGFMQRLHLPTSEMDLVALRWRNSAGKKPLARILDEALSDKGRPKPGHKTETLQQILEHQLNCVREKTREAQISENTNRGGTHEKIQDAITILNAFENQFRPQHDSDFLDDSTTLSDQVIGLFIDLIERTPIPTNRSGIWQALRKAREDAMSNVVCSIPWEKLRSVILDPSRTHFDLISDGELQKAATGELSTVNKRFKGFLVEQFLQKMKKATASGLPDFVIEQRSPVRVLEPDRWIPSEDNGYFDLTRLKQLEIYTQSNPEIHRWVCWMVNTWLLEPAILAAHRSDEFVVTLRKMLVDSERYRKFIRVLWEAAMRGKNDNEIQKLLKNRELLIEQATAHPPPGGISVEVVNEVYPLPRISKQVNP